MLGGWGLNSGVHFLEHHKNDNPDHLDHSVAEVIIFNFLLCALDEGGITVNLCQYSDKG